MSLHDALPYMPVVAICIGLIALFVAIRVAVIRRDFWRTTLNVALGFSRHSAWKKELRRELRRKQLSALFIFISNPIKETFELPLVVSIRNPSFKSIKDIVIELIYPERFLVTNNEFKKMIDTTLETLRREGLDAKEFEAGAPTTGALLANRNIFVVEDMVKIRHHIPVLRPSEAVEFWEPLRIKIPPSAHRNSGIAGVAYDRIAQNIRAIDGMLDHCVVTYNALAENYMGRVLRTSVCVAEGSMVKEGGSDADEERLKLFTNKYVTAHWFGREPRIGIYYDIPFPLSLLFGRRKDKVEIAEFMQLREERYVGKLRKKKKKQTVAIISRLNPLKSPIGYVWMNLPMYDYYELPDEVATSEDALSHVGFEYVTGHPMEIRSWLGTKIGKIREGLKTGKPR